ncbi:Uncharacterized protein APZ42_002256, partial [Daphnia magna]
MWDKVYFTRPNLLPFTLHVHYHPGHKTETGRSVVPIIGVKISHRGLRHDAAATMALKKTKASNVPGNSDTLSGRVSLVSHNEAV